MKKSGMFSWMAMAGALVLASAFATAASADDWRDSRRGDRYERRDDRDFLSGYVERVDYRRGVVFLRDRRGGRPIAVEMMRRRGGRGIDIEDLRRGDYVTFVGDWTRGGVFEAWRIEDVESGRRRNRRR